MSEEVLEQDVAVADEVAGKPKRAARKPRFAKPEPAAESDLPPEIDAGADDATDAIDPYEDGVGYLKSKGWKPLGPPSSTACLWLDPTKPLKPRYTKAAVMAMNPRSGKVEHLHTQCGGGNGDKQPCYQTVYHPAGVPLPTVDALREQIERDQAAEIAAANAAVLGTK